MDLDFSIMVTIPHRDLREGFTSVDRESEILYTNFSSRRNAGGGVGGHCHYPLCTSAK